jgi:ABC-2 type transport system ATP-binding protein
LTDSSAIVEVRGLRKVYAGKPPVVAVDGIDLSVRDGEIYGLLARKGTKREYVAAPLT